ncbi:oxidoreductase [Staphylococcus sp. SQ8-PEA]|uniref:2-dehydropantoate 2-reductase n=1 Tax=Staphylococcus marylandisciuri TaxID=2981529 RepID=A0ABT2QQN7_9STAP|nr:oxidoreductase [Staphylococcus marylandisciuri]MCU5746294.1 oxidoreductase [Staphylococcus marylandisciuri]
MRYGIVGPGAVGTTIAYEILRAHKDVTLMGKVDKSVHYFPGNDQDKSEIPVSSLSHTHEKFDVVFIAVKAHQLSGLIQDIQRITHESSIVVLAQNGYRELSSLPFQHIYQAVVYISGQKEGNEVKHFRDEILHLQDTPHTQYLKEDLSNSGLKLKLESAIESKIWYKLLVNLGINSVTALGRQPARILKVKGMTTLISHLINDGIKVAQAEGLNFTDNMIDEILDIYSGYPEEMGTSMYYDVLNGDQLEVDYIQGYIYSCAQKHHLAVPYLESIYTLLSAYKSN